MNPEFEVHMLNETGKRLAKGVAKIFDDCLNQLSTYCPAGREWNIVKAKLEEACFFAKKSIATEPINQQNSGWTSCTFHYTKTDSGISGSDQADPRENGDKVLSSRPKAQAEPKDLIDNWKSHPVHYISTIGKGPLRIKRDYHTPVAIGTVFIDPETGARSVVRLVKEKCRSSRLMRRTSITKICKCPKLDTTIYHFEYIPIHPNLNDALDRIYPIRTWNVRVDSRPMLPFYVWPRREKYRMEYSVPMWSNFASMLHAESKLTSLWRRILQILRQR